MPPSSHRVSLASLDDAEREAFLELQAVEYADEKARAGVWTREESLGRARAEIRTTIQAPRGRSGHHFYKGVDELGRRIGWVWVGPVPEAPPNETTRWLYQITVPPELRGQGYGRALLQATEQEVRTAGAREIRLNVFAWNTAAIALYRSSGYETAAEYASGFELRKQLV